MTPPGLEKRQRFYLNQKPWIMVPGLVVILVIIVGTMWVLLNGQSEDMVIAPGFVISDTVFRIAMWILVCAALYLCGMVVLRILQGHDRVQYVDLERRRIEATGMGLFRRQVVIDYDAVVRVEKFKLGPGWVIIIRATNGKLDLPELLFTDAEDFFQFHETLEVALGGLDERGIPLFRRRD